MSALLLVAGVLAMAVGAAHSYLGERYILMRLFRRADLPHLFGSDLFTRRTLRFAWHLTTIAWWGAAILFFAQARNGLSGAAATQILAAMFLVTAAATYVGSRGRHLAWLVFLAIGLAAWFGAAAS